MRLAVPLFDQEVAPRFACAREVLVVDLGEDGRRRSERYSWENSSWTARLHQLSQWGVQVLLCGGINRQYLPLAQSLDIRVIWGLRGEADALIDAFRTDSLPVPDLQATGTEREHSAEAGRGPRRVRKKPGPGWSPEVEDA